MSSKKCPVTRRAVDRFKIKGDPLWLASSTYLAEGIAMGTQACEREVAKGEAA